MPSVSREPTGGYHTYAYKNKLIWGLGARGRYLSFTLGRWLRGLTGDFILLGTRAFSAGLQQVPGLQTWPLSGCLHLLDTVRTLSSPPEPGEAEGSRSSHLSQWVSKVRLTAVPNGGTAGGKTSSKDGEITQILDSYKAFILRWARLPDNPKM